MKTKQLKGLTHDSEESWSKRDEERVSRKFHGLGSLQAIRRKDQHLREAVYQACIEHLVGYSG